MTTVVISQPMLFPWIGMFEQMALADVYVHYDDVKFSKGSFVNRVQLQGPSRQEWLTVPLDRSTASGPIRTLRADERQDWRPRQLRQLQLHYANAPHLGDALEQLTHFHRSKEALATNLMLTLERVAATLFDVSSKVFLRSSQLDIAGSGSQRVLEIVRHLNASTYVTGHGAKAYLQHEEFERLGIEVMYMDYAKVPYPQMAPGFNPHVSILDGLACRGPAVAQQLSPRLAHWRSFL